MCISLRKSPKQARYKTNVSGWWYLQSTSQILSLSSFHSFRIEAAFFFGYMIYLIRSACFQITSISQQRLDFFSFLGTILIPSQRVIFLGSFFS